MNKQYTYIDDGFNSKKERVILWSLGNYKYELEIASKVHPFEAEYYDALTKFKVELAK